MANPEVRIASYKGATIALLLNSGRFKAEFGSHRKTVYVETLAAIKSAVDAAIQPRMFERPIPAYPSDYSYGDQTPIEVLGIAQSERGPVFLIRKEGQEETTLASTVLKRDAEVDIARNKYIAARDAFHKANEADSAAREEMARASKAAKLEPANFVEEEV